MSTCRPCSVDRSRENDREKYEDRQERLDTGEAREYLCLMQSTTSAERIEMDSTIVKSGGPSAGATIYCKRIYQHPFNGFEIVLVAWHWSPEQD